MNFVKLDPETKFKWPNYGVGMPLSKEDDQKVKRVVQRDFTDILNVFLSGFKLPPCTSRLKMITQVVLGNKIYINSPLFGVYKTPDGHTRLRTSELNDSLKTQLELLFLDVSDKLDLDFTIEHIKKKFRECASNNYFVISLTATPLRALAEGESYITHSNILVIAKNRGIVYWIEPQTTINKTYEDSMISAIKTLVTEIGMVDPTVVNPVEVCPQAVTKDENCMFWSLTLFFLLLLNPQERDHNVLIKRFMEKYPTKEALEGYINGLKGHIKTAIDTQGAGRKQLTRKRRSKKRKTYRKK